MVTKSFDIQSPEFEKELRRLSRGLDRLRKGESNRAIARVLNRGVMKSRTLIVRETARAIGVKQKPIRPRIKLRRATALYQVAKVWIGVRDLSAMSLGARAARKGYRAGRHHWKSAFATKSPQGKDVILQRKGAARHPLARVSVAIRNDIVQAADTVVKRIVQRDLRLEIHRELTFRIRRVLDS